MRQGQSAQDPNVPAEATERYQACRVAHCTGGLGGTRHGDRALAKLDAQCCLLWKSKVRALENIVYNVWCTIRGEKMENRDEVTVKMGFMGQIWGDEHRAHE